MASAASGASPKKRRRAGAGGAGSSSQPKRQRAVPCVLLQPGANELSPGTLVTLLPDAFRADSDSIMRRLRAEVAWQQQEITVMGHKVMQPRLVAYMADDPSLSYTYSRTQQTPLPWSPTVARIKAELEQLAGTSFNSCLLNLYRGGQDSLSWHSDNEPVYGPTPTIGSVSFGAPRDFLLRQNADRSRRFQASLGGGAALLMADRCQADWQHSVPKRAGSHGERINLTFRTLLTKERRSATDKEHPRLA